MTGHSRSIRGLAAMATLALTMVLTTAIAPPIEAAPEGQISFAVHVTLAPKWLDPGETESAITPFMMLFLDFVEQWEPKSPRHDQRVRLAASLAIDRKAINDAEALGFSGLTGNIVPRHMEFALPIEPHPYDPKRAKQLLAEAGYANGFDAGDLTPNPPYFGMGEAITNYLAAVGIRTRLRSMERAAFLTAYREKKLKGVVMAPQGTAGNAATRVETRGLPAADAIWCHDAPRFAPLTGDHY